MIFVVVVLSFVITFNADKCHDVIFTLSVSSCAWLKNFIFTEFIARKQSST